MSLVPLPALSLRLRELTGAAIGPSYGVLYRATLSGRLPAQQENGKFYFNSDDLPGIARALGMMPAKPAAARGLPTGRTRRPQPAGT